MASTPYTVLISGANRGLGKGLLELYLARPNHTVIAANRDPDSAASKVLHDIPKAEGTRLLIVRYEGTLDDGSSGIPTDLASHGVDQLDLVIANAGVSYTYPSVATLKISDLEDHMGPNVYGTVRLYQAILPLLKKSTNPKWVTMGSSAGSIGGQPEIPNAAYGPSKAAVHWLTKRIDAEEPELTAFVMDPGWVNTELGYDGAVELGKLLGVPNMTELLITLDESRNGMIQRIDEATKETHGGKMVRIDGSNPPW